MVSWGKVRERERDYQDVDCLQDVANDADAPHVSAETDLVEVYDLRRHEFRSAE